MPMRLAFVSALAGALAACGRATAPDADAAAAHARAVAWLAKARFEDADPSNDCRPDCREQQRGFGYARQARMERPDDCILAAAQSHGDEDFIEGCRAYGQYLEAAGRGN